MIAPTFVVAQWFRDHDNDPVMVHFCAVTYAGANIAAAVEELRAPVLSVLVRLMVWRDGACSERWERLVKRVSQDPVVIEVSYQRQERSMDEDWPKLITHAGPWRAVGDPIHKPEDLAAILAGASVCCGCDSVKMVKPYRVRNHGGGETAVRYCDGCAELAAVDWNGETAAITPVPEASDG